MLLEQLNSKSCKERYSTCKLLPELSGGINKVRERERERERERGRRRD